MRDLNKRPFWLAGTIKAITFGDSVLRFVQGGPVTAANVSDVNIGKAQYRTGNTSLANVVNRSLCMTLPTGDRGPVVHFGTYVVDMPAADTDIINSVACVNYGTVVRYDPIVGVAIGGVCDTPKALDDLLFTAHVDQASGLLRRGGLVLGSPYFDGQFVAMLNADVAKVAADQNVGAVTTGFSLAGKQARGLVAISPDSAYTMLNYSNFGRSYSSYQVSAFYGRILGSSVVASAASDFVTAFGLESGRVNGYHMRPLNGDECTVPAKLLHGIHKSVQAVVLDKSDYTKAVALHAEFSIADAVAILEAQRQFSDSTTSSQIAAVIATLNGLAAGTVLHLYCAEKPVPAQDIYKMKQIAQAFADGADQGDIDSYVVNGAPLSTWRANCASAPAVSTLLWLDVPTPALPDRLVITATSVAPFYTALKVGGSVTAPAGSYVVRKAECQAIADAHPLAYVSADAVKASLSNLGLDAHYANDLGAYRGKLNIDSVRPWEDLPAVWFKRYTVRGLQPLANSLRAAIVEAASLFE